MIALKNVLVATDFGDASVTALKYGRELARRFGAVLHVLHVSDDVGVRLMTSSGLPYDVSGLQSEIESTDRTLLDAAVPAADRSEIKVEIVQLTSTLPAHAIVSYAREARVDLIVIGTHGRGPVAHLLLGSVAERVVRTAPCPVLTVRHPEHEFITPEAKSEV